MTELPSVVTGSWGCGERGWSILVHGGAGDIDPARRPLHVAGCEAAARRGAAILAGGGSALDAVEEAVRALEDDPLFNAGTGACLNADGAIELDASIMDGAALRAGGVAALPPFRNPIAIARRVLEATPHVLLAGEPAARFAEAEGFVSADPAAMITDRARTRWEAARRAKKTEVSTGGTVGAVACDAQGLLAAATSTGGMVNKLPGRVGDSAIVGAGTYADEAAACSTTGHGEAFIRVAFAKAAVDAFAPGAASRASAELAVAELLARMHAKTGGTGGAILAVHGGMLGLARTTATMTWAAVTDRDRASGA